MRPVTPVREKGKIGPRTLFYCTPPVVRAAVLPTICTFFVEKLKTIIVRPHTLCMCAKSRVTIFKIYIYIYDSRGLFCAIFFSLSYFTADKNTMWYVHVTHAYIYLSYYDFLFRRPFPVRKRRSLAQARSSPIRTRRRRRRRWYTLYHRGRCINATRVWTRAERQEPVVRIGPNGTIKMEKIKMRLAVALFGDEIFSPRIFYVVSYESTRRNILKPAHPCKTNNYELGIVTFASLQNTAKSN